MCVCINVWGVGEAWSKEGPMKKGVKHTEKHFSVEKKKERVRGRMRGEEKAGLRPWRL